MIVLDVLTTDTEALTAFTCECDMTAIYERLDNIINILIMLLIVCGMLFGSLLFRHFRK